MKDEAPTCPACGQALLDHWQCQICRCLGHDNIKARADKAICKPCDKALAKRGVRRCTACREIKALARFHIINGRYRRRQCKTCFRRTPTQKAYQAAWAARNRETINAAARRRYEEQAEKKRAWNRAYYRRNHARCLARFARYRADPEKRERRRRWLATNQARVRGWKIRWYIRRKLAILRGER